MWWYISSPYKERNHTNFLLKINVIRIVLLNSSEIHRLWPKFLLSGLTSVSDRDAWWKYYYYQALADKFAVTLQTISSLIWGRSLHIFAVCSSKAAGFSKMMYQNWTLSRLQSPLDKFWSRISRCFWLLTDSLLEFVKIRAMHLKLKSLF